MKAQVFLEKSPRSNACIDQGESLVHECESELVMRELDIFEICGCLWWLMGSSAVACIFSGTALEMTCDVVRFGTENKLNKSRGPVQIRSSVSVRCMSECRSLAKSLSVALWPRLLFNL